MAFRIVLPRKMDIVLQMANAERKLAPRHSMALLANELQAVVHQPEGSVRYPLRSSLLPSDELWSLAHQVTKCATSEDVVFCTSEAGGLQLAAQYSGVHRRPRIAVFVHNLDRPRTKMAMRLWQMQRTIDVFAVCSTYQAEFLKHRFKLPDDRVQFVTDHTDDLFFTPGAPSSSKRRPLIVSVGLEQRDYKTLALATSSMDVDVRVSGFSTDAKVNSAFPNPLPANMERRFYEWPELVQLYRDADAVVVSCHENSYAAGVQSLMEGSSCGRPIIATRTTGLQSYLNDAVLALNPYQPNELAYTIRQLLSDRQLAQRLATAALRTAQKRYRMDRYVAEIAALLRRLA